MSIEQIIRAEIRQAIIDEVLPILEEIQPSAPTKPYYSPEELAEITPFKPQTIRDLYNTGKLPGAKINNKIVFKLDCDEMKGEEGKATCFWFDKDYNKLIQQEIPLPF